MYCILHLPRTGSHYLHSLINSSLCYSDPRHNGTVLEPFNPRFNSIEEIEKKYNEFTNNDPPSTVKLVINHHPDLADRFINHPKYTTIFIKPKNYRKRLLKALVEKHLDSYSNGSDRRDKREPYVGSLRFEDNLLIERFEHYKLHMEYENRCDFVFYDEYIFKHPNLVLSELNLTYVLPRYKRITPFYSDDEMLTSVDDFNNQYDRISMDMFGKII